MKRKKAMAFNERGPTINSLSAESINRIMNRTFPCAVSNNNGVGMRYAEDLTYRPNRGSFRRCFKLLTEEDVENGADFDIFKIGQLWSQQTGKPIDVFCFYGYRITIDIFDENVIVDFTKPIYKDSCLEYSLGKFLVTYSKRYRVKVINEHLVSVWPK